MGVGNGSDRLDPAAAIRLEELFRDEYRPVVRMIRRRVCSQPVAEDLAMMVFAEAGARLAREPEAPMNAGWLSMVARRRIIDHYRRLATASAGSNTLAASARSRRRDDLDDAVDRSDLCEALMEIHPRRRIAIVLRYWEDCSVADVAEIMGTSARSAEALLSRGRADLAQRTRTQVV